MFVIVPLLRLDVPPSSGDKHPSCLTYDGCWKYHLSKVCCLVRKPEFVKKLKESMCLVLPPCKSV
ncbi:hypothetical protein KY285_001313 [Solanum tuberosum]|nr:hypothetical protein KY285_001313 [Solanum tuberosum]